MSLCHPVTHPAVQPGVFAKCLHNPQLEPIQLWEILGSGNGWTSYSTHTRCPLASPGGVPPLPAPLVSLPVCGAGRHLPFLTLGVSPSRGPHPLAEDTGLDLQTGLRSPPSLPSNLIPPPPQVRKGFWKQPPLIWDVNPKQIRILNPFFMEIAAEKLLSLPMQQPRKIKQVRMQLGTPGVGDTGGKERGAY